MIICGLGELTESARINATDMSFWWDQGAPPNQPVSEPIDIASSGRTIEVREDHSEPTLFLKNFDVAMRSHQRTAVGSALESDQSPSARGVVAGMLLSYHGLCTLR
mmetsp:Transcript_11242/g.13283  ORF Transcript_11242/g.13283 Transcript_11242/m.13283 type:complete len:106 (-) Transcript_11242:131-448(-)